MLLSLILLFVCQDFSFHAPDIEGEVGQEVGGSFFIDEVTNPGTTLSQGFSLQFGVSTVAGIQTVVPGAGIVAALGFEPEFFMHQNDGIINSVGCVYSLQAPTFLVFDPAIEVAKASFIPTQEASVAILFLQPGNVVTVGGQDVMPFALNDGSVTGVASADADFIRGDINNDGGFSISDPISGLFFMFGQQTIPCEDAADFNDDGVLGVEDVILELLWLFGDSMPPTMPFPGCGPDVGADTLGCEMTSCP